MMLEIYALDPAVSLFRVLRRLWSADDKGRPLLALLMAIVRDPPLAATAEPIVEFPVGEELRKTPLREANTPGVNDRFNDATLDKVVRTPAPARSRITSLAGPSESASQGTTAPAAAAFAFYLASQAGFRGEEPRDGLDPGPRPSKAADLRARTRSQTDLLDVRIGDRVFDISFRRLDPQERNLTMIILVERAPYVRCNARMLSSEHPTADCCWLERIA